MEGWADKRGGFLGLWRKRYFRLKDNTLSWAHDNTGAAKCLLIANGNVQPCPQAESGRSNCLKVVTADKTLVLSFATASEAGRWMSKLSVATSVSTSTPTSTAIQSEPVQPKLPLPTRIEIEGSPLVDTELRVRTLGCDLDVLCCVWFRLPARPGMQALHNSTTPDITAAEGYATITGASMQCYTLQAADEGSYVGCLVRRAVGPEHVWALSSSPVAPLDSAASATIRIRLKQHEHHKYCDRRVRVCTTPGKYREGEIVQADLRVGTGSAIQYDSWWYRSIGTSQLLGSESTDGPLLQAAKGLTYELVRAPQPSELSPAPPDHAPAPSMADVQAHMVKAALAAAQSASAAHEYALFRADVGKLLLVAAIPAGMEPPARVVSPGLEPARLESGMYLSPPIGPVEAAPPRCREITVTVEGAVDASLPPQVGQALLGWVYYFGGVPGAAEVSWVAIGDDGDTKVVKGPAQAALPGEGGEGQEAWRFVVPPELVGHIIKLRVLPVRSDGNSGHTESSRPTKEVVQAAATAA